jgi:hypothetical protein
MNRGAAVIQASWNAGCTIVAGRALGPPCHQGAKLESSFLWCLLMAKENAKGGL